MRILIILSLILISMTDGFLNVFWETIKTKDTKEIKKTMSKFPNLANNLAKLDIAINLSEPFVFSRIHKNRFIQLGLIKWYGYPAEKHTVTTSDGFILEMHRIKSGKGKTKAKPFPALLMHGMGCNSACYLTNDVNSLAFVLADEGYDVWMGNFRANSFSSKHKSLKMDSPTYWDHSWHEMGVTDTPAMIDYVLKVTKKKKLFHIGHSMGAGTFYVMTSSLPKYNDKIVAHFSMGPATFLSQTKNNFYKSLAGRNSYVAGLIKLFGVKHFPFDAPIIKKAAAKFCAPDAISKLFCVPIFLVLGGLESRQINTSLFPLFLKYTPDKISTRVMLHFLQSIKHGKFRMYDPENRMGKGLGNGTEKGAGKGYGKGKKKGGGKGKEKGKGREKGKENGKGKGKKPSKNNDKKPNKSQPEPKAYNLKQVTAPVFILSANGDNTVTNKDAEKLFKNIGSKKKEFIKIGDEKYGHIDHIWHINAKTIEYGLIVKKMAAFAK